jgi:hypothetical protein
MAMLFCVFYKLQYLLVPVMGGLSFGSWYRVETVPIGDYKALRAVSNY